jgi:hypothetical protein
MNIEEKVKSNLLARGFKNEALLSNRGLVAATIDETILEVVKNFRIPDGNAIEASGKIELIDGYTPIYRCSLTKEQFGLSAEEALRQDLAEEFAVCADPKAHGGLIVYGKYDGVWRSNPWSHRFLIRVLLEQIGIEIPTKPDDKEKAWRHRGPGLT